MRPKNRHERKENDSLEESASLSAPEVIALKITDDLEAALE